MLCRITQSSDAHRTESVSVIGHEQTLTAWKLVISASCVIYTDCWCDRLIGCCLLLQCISQPGTIARGVLPA